jgi:hypothetical protein
MTQRPDDPDAEPTAEELAEAEAFARALDPKVRSIGQTPAAPAELDAAQLLRHSRDGGALPADRAAAVLARLETEQAQRRRRMRWLVPAVAISAAAAVAMVFFASRDPAPDRTASIPRPRADLLRAQVAAASGESTAELNEAMRAYRDDVYGALARRYGAGEE